MPTGHSDGVSSSTETPSQTCLNLSQVDKKLSITVIIQRRITGRKILSWICAVHLLHYGMADADVTVLNSLVTHELVFE